MEAIFLWNDQEVHKLDDCLFFVLESNILRTLKNISDTCL